MEGFILFYTYLQGFSLVSVVVRLLLSVICGGVIGYGRERHGRAAGLRTHILVCLGSAIATLIGHYCISVLELSSDPMRIGAQVLSGIGFLGAGTIISRGRFQVTGLTTAAGLWATASIGLAIGIGFYEAAVLGAFFVVLTMSIVTKLDKTIVKKSHKLRIYAELKNMNAVNDMIVMLTEKLDARSIQVTNPRSGISGNCGIEATISVKNEADGKQILRKLTENEDIVYALSSI